MRKLFAVVLAFVLSLALAPAALAEDPNTTSFLRVYEDDNFEGQNYKVLRNASGANHWRNLNNVTFPFSIGVFPWDQVCTDDYSVDRGDWNNCIGSIRVELDDGECLRAYRLTAYADSAFTMVNENGGTEVLYWNYSTLGANNEEISSFRWGEYDPFNDQCFWEGS